MILFAPISWMRRHLMRRFVIVLGVLLLLLVGALYVVAFRPLRDPHPAVRLAQGALAIQNAKIYTSPDAPPIERGTIVVRDGRIAAVGPNDAVPIPADAQILPCDHCVVTAGFWNAHIH